MPMAQVDPDDLHTVLNELDRRGARKASLVAAADRLRASVVPTLWDALPLSDPGAPTDPPSHGRETEDAARFALYPHTGTLRRRVLHAIARAGVDGITDQELETELGLERPTPGNRRNELVRGGWVRDSGDRRPTRAGNPAVVWVLTLEGARRLAHHQEGPTA